MIELQGVSILVVAAVCASVVFFVVLDCFPHALAAGISIAHIRAKKYKPG